MTLVEHDFSGTANSNPARSLHDVCLELERKIDAFLAESPPTPLLQRVQAQTKIAIGVVTEALRRYSLDNIALSYNGGKDCLVLLITILACLPKIHNASPVDTAVSDGPSGNAGNAPSEPVLAAPSYAKPVQQFPNALQAVYIVSPHPFPEIDRFVDESIHEYQLDLKQYALPMRAGLDQYLKDVARDRGNSDSTKHDDIDIKDGIRAIFVGTRRTDPHGEKLTHFDRTDVGWPDFMRIHPVIDWHLAEIWAFLRHLDIPYLALYDQGYTSLGGVKDTHPNPRLKRSEAEGGGFGPAYELVNDADERLGRDR